MNSNARLMTLLIRKILTLLCIVEGNGLDSIPLHGPLLLVTNHINFLEVPLLYSLLFPRNICGIAKKETWDNWFLRILFNAWEAIPIDREKPNKTTFRLINKALENRKIVGIAPEGTRSETGVLGEGHQGVAYIALQNRIPLMIIAHYGGEEFWRNLRRFRRTKITISVSPPFMLVSETKTSKEVQHEMTEQIMTRLAAMLPEQYRGVYKNLDIISDQYVKYLT
ncbi:MAG TPA: lysophospholipid acyltransferase family protein [Atribacterota bacterium]|nr:lysophospholipid acyltransferase family protein [Atribacterota bacterium]HPK86913.1 lysophospholipid acyltransferase family protein [Atribacterota bacterium]